MQIDEQEIQFKKKARRRLVGAIALVLLMVTILPMVLDDRSSDQPQQEIAISIPSQDEEEFTSSVTPYIPEETATNPTEAAGEETATAEATVADTAVQPKSAPVAEPAPVVTPQDTPLAEPKPSASPAQAATYSVQIGVFSDATNVKQLEEKLKAKGLKPSTEKLQTAQGEKIRLRAGPFATRALAEQALADIKAIGLSGMIITNK
ncbi:MAG: sporulation protein [Betaproteobacteria bacterium HGW-Betaproteobacteria-8]|nr:MAG: sporulation protein [Betaproteobacteria bacterium HGW-Betaproteobacteria-8]